MVDAFRLATELEDVLSVLNGVLDDLTALVDHDASGVYVIDRSGQRIRHGLACGYENPATDFRAPFEEHGAVGQVLACG